MTCPALLAEDLPVYPGAKVQKQATHAMRRMNAANIAYTTSDPFENVYDFYQKLGTEAPDRHTIQKQFKRAVFFLTSRNFKVVVVWDEQYGKFTLIEFIRRS